MVVARPGGSDAQQPPASFPSSPLGAVDPLGVTSLRVPERITARDAESARTEVARLLSPHDLSVTANPAAFKAHLASGMPGRYGSWNSAMAPTSASAATLSTTTSASSSRCRVRYGWAGGHHGRCAAVPDGGDRGQRHQPVDISWPASARVVMARLDRAALTRALGILLPWTGPQPVRVPSAPPSAPRPR
jgi:hypothetical protein